MRYIGVPTCPYCKKRVNIIRTWSLKRQGEYQCPRCGGISNIYLSPLIYVLALLAIFAGGSMYFFHKFVLDDIGLDTALYVFIPFGAFFLLSLLMVYLEKPVIKKVAKSEYGRKRRKSAEGESALPRGSQEYAEFSGNYPSRPASQQRRPAASRQMPINQENFNRAKQQTASMNAIHESGMVQAIPANQAPPRQQPVQRQPAASQERRRVQPVSSDIRPQKAGESIGRTGVSQAAQPAVSPSAPANLPARRTPVSQEPPQPASRREESGSRQSNLGNQPSGDVGRESSVQRRLRAQAQNTASLPTAYQRPTAAGQGTASSLYQRPAGQAMPGAYQRPAAPRPVQPSGQQIHTQRPEIMGEEPPLSNFHSQAMQRQRAIQQYGGQNPATPYAPRTPRQQPATPQPPINLSGTGYARRNPYDGENR